MLVVEHDLCPHDTLSRASEEGLHDLEEPCAKQLCNVEGAEMTAPVCDDHDDHHDDHHDDGHEKTGKFIVFLFDLNGTDCLLTLYVHIYAIFHQMITQVELQSPPPLLEPPPCLLLLL